MGVLSVAFLASLPLLAQISLREGRSSAIWRSHRKIPTAMSTLQAEEPKSNPPSHAPSLCSSEDGDVDEDTGPPRPCNPDNMRTFQASPFEVTVDSYYDLFNRTRTDTFSIDARYMTDSIEALEGNPSLSIHELLVLSFPDEDPDELRDLVCLGAVYRQNPKSPRKTNQTRLFSPDAPIANFFYDPNPAAQPQKMRKRAERRAQQRAARKTATNNPDPTAEDARGEEQPESLSQSETRSPLPKDEGQGTSEPPHPTHTTSLDAHAKEAEQSQDLPASPSSSSSPPLPPPLFESADPPPLSSLKFRIRIHARPRRYARCSPFRFDWRLRVLFEDEDLLFVNKPLGVPSQPHVSNYEESLFRQVCGAFKIETNASPLNRLDICTTGVLGIGKTPRGSRIFNRRLKEKEGIKKWYRVLSGRRVSEGEIRNWTPKRPLFGKTIPRFVCSPDVDHGESWRDCVAVVVSSEDVTDVLEVRDPPENRQTEGDATEAAEKERALAQQLRGILDEAKERNGRLYEHFVELVTGRTHQLRAQFACRGAPIVGDIGYEPVSGFLFDDLTSGGACEREALERAEKAKNPRTGIGLQAAVVEFGDVDSVLKIEAGNPWVPPCPPPPSPPRRPSRWSFPPPDATTTASVSPHSLGSSLNLPAIASPSSATTTMEAALPFLPSSLFSHLWSGLVA
uniref:Pseudouridine synthase RsuA/RluA-like domain-containing protein n=1 Tax=Chromera velia CCMP2878 TaxID=1169474 RepID=A0A0G4HCP2_9ALVE|eukprot:Cvel_6355.t1-p1 / transcript=Cvel_6355.t1 / gene=Cvel_6355 / organism=Chromera_velia_CCMP2878 / gene_product=RNA pseudouridine synthase 6, chloroplastic, putative / transcript_product=RNA pseudouridine synthase 6, chloroplastic, putative / location=Cvel_scaffold309:36414-42469(+) / protein_length=679 / sequence_SO=supercontig / SO=protein_coding / is_pseudo=false